VNLSASIPRSVFCLAVLFASLLNGCDRGPPTEFRVTGDFRRYQESSIEFKDAYVWQQPRGDSAIALLSDRKFPTLPTDDAYAAVDLGLLLTWSQASLVELELDAKGELQAVHMRAKSGGSTVRCAANPGQCYSSVGHWSAEGTQASYEFGRDLDVSLAQPIHRQKNFQTPVTAETRTDPNGDRTSAATADHQRMSERYTRVRTALDEGGVAAFLKANGYDQPLIDALGKFEGLDTAVKQLATDCPKIGRVENFGNDGGFGSLLIYGAEDNQEPVYFLRRGEEWLLHSCGRG
jgi:hypothetical protein